MDLIVSFKGGDADKHHIEAYAGLESISGIARALTLIAHYMAEGEVRRRYPFSEKVVIYLEDTEEGSFNWKFSIAVAGTIAVGMATNAIYDVTKAVFLEVIGQGEDDEPSEETKIWKDTKNGDFAALVEAVEPSINRGHYGVGQTIEKIEIKRDTTETVTIVFDEDSKEYLRENIEGDVFSQDVTISSLNVNDRTGRAYFSDLHRTVPFKISTDASSRTMPSLSSALNSYARKMSNTVHVKFIPILSTDNRLKKIIILDAYDISELE